MNATLKIIINLIYIVILFFAKTWLAYGIMFGVLVLACIFIRMPFKDIFNFIIKVLPFIIFIAMVNMFFIEGENVVVWGIFKVSAEGIEFAIKMVIRIICLILVNKILLWTTAPLALAKGIENIMRPLKIFKFPVKEFAMIISIALRFVPILEEELKKIIISQKARGAEVDSKNIIIRIKYLKSIIVPLLISIFRRSEQIAVAMESRCYHNI